MNVSVPAVLAAGLATAGVSVALAVPAAAAPSSTANSTASSQHVVRNSAKATPNGGTSHKPAASSSSTKTSSAPGSAPTSNKRVLSSDPGTPVAVKHHWGTHHGHGLF